MPKKAPKFLNNNPNLPVDVEFEWTEELLLEYKKAMDDVLYFASNFFYIINVDDGKIKIKLHDAQKRIVDTVTHNRFTAICASRQTGKTTIMTIICLWYILFRKDYKIVILANKEDMAKEILDRIKMSYEEMPNWLKPGIEEFTKETIRLKNGSRISVSTTSVDAARGKAINLVFLDEFAFVRPEIADQFFKSVIPTISSGKTTKLIITSTPNGMDNKFYEIFSEAEKKKSIWAVEKFYWHEIPGRDEKWKEDQLALINYDMKMWDQEYDIMFLDTNSSSVNGSVIDRLKSKCKAPIFTADQGDYKVWEEPIKGHIYVFGIDTSEGVGADNSVCQILDITDLTDIKQVGKYCSNRLIPALFAEKLASIIPSWGRPFLCVESNAQGAIVLNDFINIYKFDNIVTHNMKNDKEGRYQKPGIFCHTNSKSNGITNLIYWVEHLAAVTLFDIETVKEFETFVRKENKVWSAKKGFKDDHYMALMWALFLLDAEISEKYLDVLENDETGHPTRILDPNSDLALTAFTQGNRIKSFRRGDAEPLPFFYQGGNNGRSINTERADDMAGYALAGWRMI